MRASRASPRDGEDTYCDYNPGARVRSVHGRAGEGGWGGERSSATLHQALLEPRGVYTKCRQRIEREG